MMDSGFEYELRETLISISDVCLQFGDNVILNHVNGSVRDIVRPGCTQGQVIGILGPSGIGKTQLSKILAGLQRPTSGAVIINESNQEVRAGLVGMVAQNYPLFNHRTVLGNLLVAARQAGLDSKDAHAKSEYYLEKFDLTNRARNYPCQLSGGQRQRVAIIQQILCSEHFLIMDEPFTGLDPLKKDMVCDLINKVALLDEKNTIFVVAHDIPCVAAIADKLWLIGRDRDEHGTPIPGSRIQVEFDLVERNIAWHPGVSSTPAFSQLMLEVKDRFKSL